MHDRVTLCSPRTKNNSTANCTNKRGIFYSRNEAFLYVGTRLLQGAAEISGRFVFLVTEKRKGIESIASTVI